MSLFIDCFGLKHLKITVAKNPKRTANNTVTKTAANWSPPCLGAFVDNYGVLPSLPPAKMALKIPPKKHIITASIEYPLSKMKEAYLSKTNNIIGQTIPISKEAKGSIMTKEEDPINIPV